MSNKKCPKCFEALAKKDNSYYCNNCETDYLEKYLDHEYIANNYQNIKKQYLVEYKPIDFGVKPSNYLEIYESIKSKYLKVGKVSGFDYQDYLNKYGVQTDTEEEQYVDKFDDVSFESLSSAEKALVAKLKEQIRNNPENAAEVFEIFEEEVKSNENLSSESIRGIFCNIIHDVPEENKKQYIGLYHGALARVKNHEQREAKGRVGYAIIQETLTRIEEEFESYNKALYRVKEYQVIQLNYNKAVKEVENLDKYSVTANDTDAIVERFKNNASRVKTKLIIKKIKRKRITITSIVVAVVTALIVIGFIPTPVYMDVDSQYLYDLKSWSDREKTSDFSDDIFYQSSEYMYFDDALAFAGFKGLFWENCFNKKVVEVESYVDGKPVIGITSYAFDWNEKLEEVYLPDTIQFIEQYAFNYCPNLKIITASSDIREDINVLPNSIEYIGRGAFEGIELDNVLLPSELQYVYGDSFNQMTNVEYPGDSGRFDDICIYESLYNVEYSYITINFYKVLDQNYADQYNTILIDSLRVNADSSKVEFTAPNVLYKGYDLKGYSYLHKEDNLIVDETLKYSGKGFKNTINLFTYYEPTVYNIKYELDGGQNSPVNVDKYTIEDYISIYDPSKVGYTFEGWYKDRNFIYPADTDFSNSTDDKTYFAKFTANKYNVEYPYELTVTYDYNYSGSTPYVVTYGAGSTISYMTPTRDGYQFRGWFTNAACTDYYSFNENVISDLTLYAGWEEKTYDGSSINPYSYTSSSDYYSTYINSTYYTYKYLTVNESGYHDIYYKVDYSGSSYKIALVIYNETTNTYIFDSYIRNTSFSYKSFYANAGDVIRISYGLYSYSNTLYLYFNGFNRPTSNSSVAGGNLTVTYDHGYTIPFTERNGYQFIGYYTEENGQGRQFTSNEGVSLKPWDIADDTEIYPYYEPIDYTITYTDNGGTTTDTKVESYNIETETFTLPTMTKTGYTFNGWYKDSSFSGDALFEIAVGTYGNLELYAKFTPNTYLISSSDNEITVTYDYNYSGATASEVTYNMGDTISYPTKPTRSEYIFRGWFKDSSCSELFDFTENVFSDITLYAGWQTLASYNYSYQITNPENYTSSNLYSIQSTSSYKYVHFAVTETGTYTIYYKQNYTGSYYQLNVSLYNMTTGTTVMSNRYTDTNGYYTSYTFEANAGDVIYLCTYCYSNSNYLYFYFEGFDVMTSTSTVGKTVNYDQAFTISYEEIPGYEFKGYYTSENAEGTQITDASGNSLENWTRTENLTVYPYYEKATYTITYNDNGGTTEDTKVESFQIDTDTFALPVMTKTGYTFEGWSEYSSGFDAGITHIYSGTNRNITLYAIFTANQYDITYPGNEITVTYNYNYYGSGSYSTVYQIGDAVTYPTKPTRSGYIFRGWFKDSSCTEFFDFTESLENDLTLYAGWQSLVSSSYSYYQITSPENYNTSSNAYSIQSTSSYKYVHFAVNETGTYTIYYKQNYTGSYYQLNVSLYNMTTGTTVMSNRYTDTNGYYTSYTFEANAGDVIYLCTYRYSNSNYLYFYFEGFEAITSSSTVTKGENQTLNVTYDQSYTLPFETINGVEFKGYFTAENGEGTQITDGTGNSLENWTRTENLMVYPYYEKATYTITYNDNGGTTTDTKVESFQVDTDTFTLPVMTKTGYVFDGWFESEDFSGTAITEVAVGTYRNLTLYAKFTANSYTISYEIDACVVTYDYNYSGSIPTQVVYVVGETIEYPTNPTRSGYVFIGWYTESSCINKYDFSGEVSANVTLYAKWSDSYIGSSSWTVSGDTFYSNNTSHNSSSSLTITAPCKVTISFNYSVSSENGWDYLNIYVNGSQVDTISGSISGKSYTCTLEQGQYIQFTYSKDSSNSVGSDRGTISNFTITSAESYVSTAIVTSSLTGNIVQTAVTYDQTFDLPVVTKDGYTFKGYFTGENGTGTQLTDESGNSLGNWNIAENITVYPYYE